jgi:hypothetical protein
MNERHFLNSDARGLHAQVQTDFSTSMVSGSNPRDYPGHDPTDPTPPPPPPVPPG